MATDSHIGDIGTAFRITIKNQDDEIVNISSASALKVYFEKPDGTDVEKTGVFYTDGTDGIVQYITIAGDLDIAGTWKIQARITIGGSVWYSDIVKFKVKPNIVE